MKNILVLLIIVTLSSCGGYKPIFSGESVNFYIKENDQWQPDRISYCSNAKNNRGIELVKLLQGWPLILLKRLF